ncbi:MAG TPA: sigma-70 family RNA polymerase sigma factor, partial [Polyangiaceae bacterium]|nr:sigma-70 family RNA polymerase sigma factor [Polyangiaceae bacterium]
LTRDGELSEFQPLTAPWRISSIPRTTRPTPEARHQDTLPTGNSRQHRSHRLFDSGVVKMTGVLADAGCYDALRKMGMNTFLEAHAALIVRLARRVARPPTHPEDIAQEAIASLLRWHREKGFDPEKIGNAEAYLRVVVRNTAAQAARRFRGEVPAPDRGSHATQADETRPPDYSIRFADEALHARALLEQLKQRLRPREAVVLALLIEDEMSPDQVAQSLGMTMNNLYQIRHRIRAAARELLDASAQGV